MRVGEQPHVRRPAPALGDDTRSVLVDELGYAPERAADLARAGVVAGRGLPEAERTPAG